MLVDNRSGVTFDAELCIPWDAPRAVVDVTSMEAFTPVLLPHRVVLLGRDGNVDDRRILPDGDGRVVRFRRPEVRSVNRESCDVTKEAEELPTSEVTKDTSAGIPTLGTAVQSPGYAVPVEVTLGASWVPDCTSAVPVPALRKGSQPRLTAWPLLCPRPSIIAPPVVGAGLAEDNKDTAVVEATEGSGQVGVQPLSRKRLFDACNKPTETVADVCEQ